MITTYWVDAEDQIHLWVKDGYDSWELCYEGEEEGTRLPGYENASGVCLPEIVMDEFVVIRMAQLISNGTICAAIDRATDPDGRGGNFGGMVLQRNAEKLKAAFSQIQMTEPELAAT